MKRISMWRVLITIPVLLLQLFQAEGIVFYDCSKYGQICVNYFNCSNAVELINSKRAFLCGFRDKILQKDPKICCHSSNIIPVATQPPPPPPPLPVPPSSKPPPSEVISAQGITFSTLPTKTPSSKNSTAVALQKCQEYGKYRYVKVWYEPNIPGETGYYRDELDCVLLDMLLPGGYPAETKEYPHMAAIGYGNDLKDATWNCGGSLISEKFVMTAAHCGSTAALGPPRWVLLGDLTLSSTRDDDAKPKVYRIVKIHDHPNYKYPSVYYDISLFELNTTVAFSPYVRPACLYTSQADLPINDKAVVTGWEKISIGERTSSRLLRSFIFIANHQKCRTTFEVDNSTLYDSNTMICADDIQGSSLISGDPLQIYKPGQLCTYNIIGIISRRSGIFGNNDHPGIYTKVTYYLDWIQSIVWP